MNIDGFEFVLDTAAKFFNSIYVYGWFHHPKDELKSVRLIDPEQIESVSAVGLPHGGVTSLGPNKGFSIQSLRKSSNFHPSAELEFRTRRGWSRRVPLVDLCKDRISRYPSLDLGHRFKAQMNAQPQARMLDIGGRARSGVDRSREFNVGEYVVLDVLPGENVNVVGDAHELSKFFPPRHFDAVYSISVFEHLMMPWTVVVEINKVLKPGGLAYIMTHQTLGIHDQPWDFWRFSDTSWDALFNAHTGFEIVERACDFEQFIIPFIYRETKSNAEQSAGFECSAVLARKIGEPSVSWPLTAKQLTADLYPDVDDGRNGTADW